MACPSASLHDIEFLGHHLSGTGCPSLSKTLRPHLPLSSTMDKIGVQWFLGIINFYRKILRGAARVLAPLTDALKGPGKLSPFPPSWTPASTRLLSSVPELVHPQSNVSISLAVDASDSHIGASTTASRKIMVSSDILLQETV